MSKLTEALYRAQHATGDLAITQWRYALRQTRHVSCGVRNNVLGDLYHPPAYNRNLSGDLWIQWSDGLVSHGDLDPAALADVPAKLAQMRRVAYAEEHVPELPAPSVPPDVPLFDGLVEEKLLGDPDELFERLRETKEALAPLGSEQISAGFSYEVHTFTVANSKGLMVDVPSTRVHFGVDIDSRYSDGFVMRRWPTPERFHQVLEHIRTFYPALKRKAEGVHTPRTIILHPEVAPSFLGHFVHANLAGSGIAAGSSRYRNADFETGAAVIHPSLTLQYDPTVPFEASSYAMSSEGLPAAPGVLIEAGRLVNPLMSLKDAKRLGREPLSPPGSGGLRITQEGHTEFWEYLKSVESGYLVISVLGMHTQDSVRGEYSLSVDAGVVIEHGELIGERRGVLRGDFFANLNDPELRVLETTEWDDPGLAFPGSVYWEQ